MPQGTVVVKLVGGEEEVACPCGCGERHRALRGEAIRAGISEQVLFYALMVSCEKGRNLWLALGSGPWNASDPRDCFCSVQMWKADDAIHICSRVTDAVESPWKNEPMFVGNVGRLLDRNEVMGKPGKPEWLFGWTDALTTTGLPRLREFLLASDRA